MGRFLLILVALTAVLAGCGGGHATLPPAPTATQESSPVAQPGQISKALLEAEIKADATANLADDPVYANERITSVSCVADGDHWHFVCLLHASDGSSATWRSTCDASHNGMCISRAEP